MSERESLTDLVLERYQLGELPPDEMQAVTRRLEHDATLRARLQELVESDRQLRRRYSPALMAEQIRARLARQPVPLPLRARPARIWPLPAALALAATLLLVAFPPAPDPGVIPAPAGVEAVRIKGLKPALLLFRKVGDASEALGDGERASEGDQLRLGYRAAGHRYGVIVSVDGRGTVTRHLPLRDPQAARLEGGATVLLDHAYQLDDAPSWERFYFVVGDAPFPVQTVVAAAQRLGEAGPDAPERPLDLPRHLDQARISVMKGGGR